MSSLTWIVVWVAELISVIPCPLQDGVTAEKYGIKPHYACPLNHNDYKRRTERRVKLFSDLASATDFYKEMQSFDCARYDKPYPNESFDCVGQSFLGVDFSSNIAETTVPATIIDQWGYNPPVMPAEPPVPPPPPAGPVATYSFNEGTGTLVSGTSSGTVLGADWVNGKYSSALSFKGISDFVVTVGPNLGSTGTMEAWVKFNKLGIWHGIIGKGQEDVNATQNYGLEMTNNNRINCILGNGTSANVIASTGTFPTSLAHVACTWDGTRIQLYINGVFNRSITQTITPFPNIDPLFIGQFGNTDFMNGIIDEVRIYDRALSQVEIKADMNTPIQ